MGEWVRFWLTAAVLIAGLGFLAAGVIGNCRFYYVMNRIHAAGLGDTMGLLLTILALAVSALVSALMYALIPGRLSVTGGINGLLLGLIGALVYEKTGSFLPMALLDSGFGLGVSLDGFINKSSLYRVGDEIFSGNLSLIYDGLGLTLILAAMLALMIISRRPKKKKRT